METIYYKSDFCILLDLFDSEGNAIGFPQFNFSLEVMAGGKSYTAFRRGNQLSNLREHEGRIMVVCDSHGLLPGRIKVEMEADIPNAIYPDGYRRWSDIFRTNIELTSANTASATSIGTARLMLPVTGDTLPTPPDPPEEGEKPDKPDNPGCQCPDYEVATQEEVDAILKEVLGV